jgi:hypothetical protein
MGRRCPPARSRPRPAAGDLAASRGRTAAFRSGTVAAPDRPSPVRPPRRRPPVRGPPAHRLSWSGSSFSERWPNCLRWSWRIRCRSRSFWPTSWSRSSMRRSFSARSASRSAHAVSTRACSASTLSGSVSGVVTSPIIPYCQDRLLLNYRVSQLDAGLSRRAWVVRSAVRAPAANPTLRTTRPVAHRTAALPHR